MSRFSELLNSSDQKKAHLALVMAIGKIDGRIDPGEQFWAELIATTLGLTAADFKEVNLGLAASMSSTVANAIAELQALPKGDKAVVVADCMKMSYSDGNADDTEKELVAVMALSMGFTVDEANHIHALLAQGASDDQVRAAF